MVERKLLARWVSSGSKHWCELYRVPGSDDLPDWFGYYHRNGGGCMGSVSPILTEKQAVAIMQGRVDRGWFAPDVASRTLKRII